MYFITWPRIIKSNRMDAQAFAVPYAKGPFLKDFIIFKLNTLKLSVKVSRHFFFILVFYFDSIHNGSQHKNGKNLLPQRAKSFL